MSDKKSYEKAWEILKEVDDQLREHEDSQGNLKNTGEARALYKMKKALTNEISKDATDFLKRNGFNGWGLKKKKKAR